jgi:hypothetical protein
LRAATRDELETALRDIPHVFATDETPAGGELTDSRRELWPACLVLLVLVLMAEQFCAWWCGRVDQSAARRVRRAS